MKFWDLAYYFWFAFIIGAPLSVVGVKIWESQMAKRRRAEALRLKAMEQQETGKDAAPEKAAAEAAKEADAEPVAAEEDGFAPLDDLGPPTS
jgi:hypothetical protein